MKRMTLSREEMEAAARQRGFRIAAPDHPVYSEGPSIIFSSRTPSQSGPKVIDLPYSDSETSPDSTDSNGS